ncbi:MAG: hypothetical protein CL840_18425 [Crocinitomicaceae bacterium]|nr:hypothetical protein [Crocinitomicaceae bacterium]|tara:strand:+ start:7023 stop:7934 length:912 start_codon:yes stop_codon:yes gene_type:complete
MNTRLTLFTILLSGITFAYAGMAHAQNPILTGLESFETWKPAEAGQLPQYWDGFNRDVVVQGRVIGQVACVEKDSSHPVEGEYSVKLTSKPILGGPAVPGILTVGQLMVDFDQRIGDVVGGIPTQIKPDRLVGSYKYSPSGSDTGMVSVWFLEKGKQVGVGNLHLLKTTGGWAKFTVDIAFDAGAKPDSMNIMFSTSLEDTLAPAGSVLELDAISFDFNSSVEQYNQQHFQVFPNPASTILNVKAEHQGEALIQLIDNSGRICLEMNEAPLNQQIDVSGFDPGLYHLRVVYQNQQYTSVLIVE